MFFWDWRTVNNSMLNVGLESMLHLTRPMTYYCRNPRQRHEYLCFWLKWRFLPVPVNAFSYLVSVFVHLSKFILNAGFYLFISITFSSIFRSNYSYYTHKVVWLLCIDCVVKKWIPNLNSWHQYTTRLILVVLEWNMQ